MAEAYVLCHAWVRPGDRPGDRRGDGPHFLPPHVEPNQIVAYAPREDELGLDVYWWQLRDVADSGA